jgi:hypothetical protein
MPAIVPQPAMTRVTSNTTFKSLSVALGFKSYESDKSKKYMAGLACNYGTCSGRKTAPPPITAIRITITTTNCQWFVWEISATKAMLVRSAW